VSGFTSNGQFFDLLTIGSAGASLVYTPNALHPTTSGVLTVGSGGKAVAKINMVGDYTTPDFNPGNDGTGHLAIFDPPVVEQKAGMCRRRSPMAPCWKSRCPIQVGRPSRVQVAHYDSISHRPSSARLRTLARGIALICRASHLASTRHWAIPRTAATLVEF
jgi:hypothetical protein